MASSASAFTSSSSSTSQETQTVTRADGTTLEVPDKFLCPITLNIMTHPLCNRAGLNYDRRAILSWLETKGTCPLTRQPLRPSQLIPNRLLETQINQFRRQHNYYDDIVGSGSSSHSATSSDSDASNSTNSTAQGEEEQRFIGFLPVSEDKHAEVLERHGLSGDGNASSLIRLVAAIPATSSSTSYSNNSTSGRNRRNFLGFPRRNTAGGLGGGAPEPTDSLRDILTVAADL
mmetsp:Transcript_2023/g.4100  ORF Transcript_2023/g.4100 Transcript_2023/m.4100 type:complete len:232 (+) Transcript_2023:122-817(+)|eukprot:CAMPEP_0168740330 /NCGR_PEP_ID=MMETSP0724-20121128/11926_1 /TAXON_ID=265536 /ORGANISM="Amphiprora sp., Strain CCMP467" /LENGTH=231 /DNA_ID=CAMNT_0008787767 /DNA_START=105 /DNA_END=800 /DNA_ORIENTATION=-